LRQASINSKKIKKNDIFFAIKGKKKDGNHYLREVFNKKASLAIVNKINKLEKKSKQIKVKNTLSFLTKTSSKVRENSSAKIIAITGSCGKTSLKELIGMTLNKLCRVTYSPKSFNNKFGVPLSLFNLNQKDDFGVFEVGMDKKNEIDTLTKIIKPDVGVITNISYAHAKNFKNLKQIALAKSEIMNNIVSGGSIVLNADDKFYKFHQKIALKKKLKVYSFSINKKNYFLIKNEKEIEKWIEEAEEFGELAIDTETSSLDVHQADLIGISLSTKIGKACYIPIGHKSENCLDKETVLKKLKPLFEDKSVKKIGQNIKFDFIVLYNHGIKMNSMEDTMLMSYVLDAGKNRHNMDTLSEIHLNHKTISFKDLVGSGKKQINFSEVELNQAMEYAAEDADITYRLYKIFNKSLKLEKLTNIYEIFEKPLIEILAFMEINGIKVDSKSLEKLSEKFEKKKNNLKKEIYSFKNSHTIFHL